MLLAFLLLSQAAAPGDPEGQRPDFLRITPKRECESKDTAEIVVCGSRSENERQRLRPLPPGYERKPLVAELGLGGNSTGGIHVESVEIAPGVTSKRIMVSIKTKF